MICSVLVDDVRFGVLPEFTLDVLEDPGFDLVLDFEDEVLAALLGRLDLVGRLDVERRPAAPTKSAASLV